MRSVSMLIFAAAIVLASGVQAASFDCAKAKAEDERAICKNPELSKLDEEMAAAYGALAKPMTGFKERIVSLRKNQSEWIKDRGRCGDTATCLKDAYVKRITWLKNPVQSYSGWWASGKYRVSVIVDADSPKPVVRLFAGPKEADFMLMELQARFVSAKDNQQEGTDAVQVTPQFQSAFRKYEGQCSVVSVNFNKDDEAYLASNESCPLFKKNDRGQSCV